MKKEYLAVLDQAFLNFIGAGLTTLAPAYSLAAPEGVVLRGREFLTRLSREHADFTRELVETTVTGIWQNWQESQLPLTVAAYHLERLPALLETVRPDPDRLIAASAVAHASERLGRNRLAVQARVVAADIIEKANETKTLEKLEINEQVTFFFLEELFAQLLSIKPTFDRYQDLLDDHLQAFRSAQAVSLPAGQAETDTEQTSLDDRLAAAMQSPPSRLDTTHKPADTAAASDVQPEPHHPTPPVATPQTHPSAASIALAEQTGAPVAAIEAVEKVLTQQYGQSERRSHLLPRSASLLRRLLDDLIAHAPHADARGARIVTAHRHLASGNPNDAEMALAEAEDLEITAAQTDLAHARQTLRSAAETRKWRGQLQEILCDFRRAARHYALAGRHLARDDHETRWRFIGRQIRALMQSARHFGDVSALAEATDLCTQALAALPRDRADRPRNDARMLLAELLVLQAGEGSGIDHLEDAAENLTKAHTFFDMHGPADRAIAAQALRADVLRRIANHKGDAATLTIAIETYRDVMTSNGRLSAHTDWKTIHTNLRIALNEVRQRAEADPADMSALDSAIAALEAMAAEQALHVPHAPADAHGRPPTRELPEEPDRESA